MRFIGMVWAAESLSISTSLNCPSLAFSDGEEFKVKLPENGTQNSLERFLSSFNPF